MTGPRIGAVERAKIRSVIDAAPIDGSNIVDGSITTDKITGLGTAAVEDASDFAAASHTHAASDITSGTIGTARLGSGSATNRTFLRGDQTWNACMSLIPKTSDEARQSTTTQTADSTLQFSMAANTIYRIRITVFYTSDATADFMYSLSGPTSPTNVVLRYSHVVPGSAAFTNFVVAGASALPASVQINGNSTDPGYITFDLMWNNGSNTGTFAFLWSQRVSTAVNTTVLAGSTLEYAVIADLGA